MFQHDPHQLTPPKKTENMKTTMIHKRKQENEQIRAHTHETKQTNLGIPKASSTSTSPVAIRR